MLLLLLSREMWYEQHAIFKVSSGILSFSRVINGVHPHCYIFTALTCRTELRSPGSPADVLSLYITTWTGTWTFGAKCVKWLNTWNVQTPCWDQADIFNSLMFFLFFLFSSCPSFSVDVFQVKLSVSVLVKGLKTRFVLLNDVCKGGNEKIWLWFDHFN